MFLLKHINSLTGTGLLSWILYRNTHAGLPVKSTKQKNAPPTQYTKIPIKFVPIKIMALFYDI